MRYIVALTAVLLMGISAFGVVAPERLAAVVVGWPPESRLYVAVGTRLVLGVVFLAGASKCRFPVVIYGVGILALAAAVLLMLLGEPRLDALIHWWAEQPALAIRAWCVLAALLGALVLSAALPAGGTDGRA